MTTNLLDVRDLEVRFFTRRGAVNAVNGASFCVRPREVVGIVGESGSGKTVSCLSVMGLLPYPGRITDGRILLGEEDLVGKPEERMQQIRGNKISIVFQDPMTYLNPVLTVGRQVSEPVQLHLGMTAAQGKKRAVDLLGMVGIPRPESCLDSYPHEFSGGMRQRVMIAMALACNPSLLIADEPTTALDVTVQIGILDLVTRLQKETGMAVIWITHDLGVIAGLADRVYIMYAGHVVESADVEDLYSSPRHPYTRGLLRSIPRIDVPVQSHLPSIAGTPPAMLDPPVGCPFRPRCDLALDKCAQMPAARTVSAGHDVACWLAASEKGT